MPTAARVARTVMEEAGTTVAHQAGIRLADKPAPLWRLLVVANLLSARISAAIAIAAARELVRAGGGTARGMAGMSWQQRVDALGRGHYVRYDESTATRLGDCARLALDLVGGDLRRLPAVAERDPSALRRQLQRFSGIGPTGADIFCREAQHVWPWLRPYADRTTLRGAQALGLPQDPEELAALVNGEDVAAFFTGLVHTARDSTLAGRIREAA
ncbi:hypothetical protein [Allosalinactinospora lopnorensis]|uniref:hypothetical protein n=1 Tax=Allosalinactinospora lopnorensis TaxID=1352348 RepID=UPI000623CE25|nr:hypothetical protein [Allosalinactinospora lopnorensis]